MSRKRIQIIIILGTLSLVGILGVQLVWLSQAYSVQEKQFNLSVQVALNQVADQLAGPAIPSAAAPPVEQLSSNFFLAKIQAPVQPAQVDSLLRQEFARRQLTVDYEYGVFNTHDDTLVFGHYIPATAPQAPVRETLHTLPESPQTSYQVAVLFPSKTSYVLSEMQLWLFSTGGLLVIVFFFAYAMVGILREKRLSELKATFINNLTHELKTPITNIAVASEVLKQGGPILHPDRQRRYHELIHAENQRLKDQVERVLQMATLERKELPLQKQEVDVHQLLQDIVQSISLRVQQRTGTLTFTPLAERPVIVADRLHVKNVVYNLLDNAEKYSPEVPEISVTTENHRDGILISIADKGIGIRKDLQKFVFDTFYRVPTGNVHDVKGFGLGLSYVKIIAEAHHGSVTLDSEMHRGSCFRLFFPYSA